jgi:putative glutamine amidotransferase
MKNIVWRPGGVEQRRPTVAHHPSHAETASWVEPKEPIPPSDATQRKILDLTARDIEKRQKAALEGKKPRCTVGVVVRDNQIGEGPAPYVRPYLHAVLDAGAVPRLLFAARGDAHAQVQKVDALLIPGGPDVHPQFYGQQPGPGMAASMARVDPQSDKFALDCIRDAYTSEMPMLGICRGMQLMNVAAGGSLVQDIPTEYAAPYGVTLRHSQQWPAEEPETTAARSMPMHDIVMLDDQSQLAQLLGTMRIGMNSIHHQCVARPGSSLSVTAIAPDGVVEAVERKDVPGQMGVQGHPELIRRADPRFDNLFTYLVDNGRAYHRERLHTRAT